MGWHDCYDFGKREYTQPETKAKEIWRVLKAGGLFVVCSWEKQEGVSWMEDAVNRHYPAILEDQEYLEQRPIGMAYEKADGYEMILRDAGFSNIKTIKEKAAFISTDEEEWWLQMMQLGWGSLIDNITRKGNEQVQDVKQAIFEDLKPYKQPDGIQFSKTVFFVCGMK